MNEARLRVYRRQALEIAAQLPEEIGDALLVLAMAREAIQHIETVTGANDEDERVCGLRLRV